MHHWRGVADIMLINVEIGSKRHRLIHWKTGEPFWASRNFKKYIYQCDNSACDNVWIGKKRAKKGVGGEILTKHYCSVKCQHKGMNMKSRMVECAHPDCSKEFLKWDSSSKKYCSNECARADAYLKGNTCKHSGCNEPVSKNNQNGYCRKHRTIGDYAKHKAILYAELGNRCACCGERDEMYLSVDHVNNDGGEYRKQSKAHYRVHRLLKHHRENPGSLQLLCTNCNHAKMRNGGELYRPAKFTRRKLEIALV